MSEEKPREFWIETHGLVWPQVYETDVVPYTIHVIEYSAYAQLQARVTELEIARTKQIINDGVLLAENKRLRDALEKIVEFKTCEELYPGCEKYVSYEAGWFGVANFAREALKDGGENA